MFAAFDSSARGEYSFAIRSTMSGDWVAINVNVAPAPLATAGLMLLTALGALGFASRRRAA